jgi:hypothetical protein
MATAAPPAAASLISRHSSTRLTGSTPVVGLHHQQQQGQRNQLAIVRGSRRSS